MGIRLKLFWTLYKVEKKPKKKSKVRKGVADEEFIQISQSGRMFGKSPIFGKIKDGWGGTWKAGETITIPVAPTDFNKGEFPIGIAMESVNIGDFVSIRMTEGLTNLEPPVLKTKDSVDSNECQVTVPDSLMQEILQEICNEVEMGPVKNFGYDKKEKEWNIIAENLSKQESIKDYLSRRIKLKAKEQMTNKDSFRRTRKIKKKINERLEH